MNQHSTYDTQNMEEKQAVSVLERELDSQLSGVLHETCSETVYDLDQLLSLKKRTSWRVVVSYFLLGLLTGLPSMVNTTAANVMFTGVTGVYEVSSSLTGAFTAFGSPFVARYIPYSVGTAICTLASALSFIICTLPHPLSGPAAPQHLAAPIIGAMLGGSVYAYGMNLYMAAAAFFPQEAVVALSAGSSCSVILGPGLYTCIMTGLDQDWRRTLLVFLPTSIGIPLVWWGLTDPTCRAAAETSRKMSMRGSNNGSASSSTIAQSEVASDNKKEHHERQELGFGPDRTRIGLLVKTILPRYVLPLVICTSSSIVTLLGTAPTLQMLNRFEESPDGNVQFQLAFLSFGCAQFIFSTLSAIRPFPAIWMWTGIEIVVMVIGLLQFAYPFLTYYGVWIVVLFLTGACVGGGVTNTDYKISEDFRRSGDSDEVRSFAMSFAGLGNVGGDALGGALGVLVQQVASKALKPSP